jgi:pimeloyl-ACP methyl ester carboxylesterase
MKLNYLLLSFILFNVTTLFGQPYAIGHATVSFIDANRNNRAIAAEIYYPANSNGDNVTVVSNNQTFPVVAFGHGFLMAWDAYQNLWTGVVPQGYIMIFPKTEGTISPSHLDFAKDLNFCLAQMTQLGTMITSLFYNRVGATNALMGHSMGGGASILAASLNLNVTALVNFAAAETSPSAIQSGTNITVPSLLISGVNDCVTPPATNQLLMYNQLNSSCKTLVQIIGGSHCQMANSNLFCNFGESSCTPIPTITRIVQHAIINDYLVKWLDKQLKNNCAQGTAFDMLLENDTRVVYSKNCNQCEPLSSIDNEIATISITPNPINENTKMIGTVGTTYTIFIYDLQMKKVLEKTYVGQTDIDGSKWQKGVYFCQILHDNKIVFQDKLLRN